MIEKLLMFVYRQAYLLMWLPLGINFLLPHESWRYIAAILIFGTLFRFHIVVKCLSITPELIKMARRPMRKLDILAVLNPKSTWKVFLMADALNIALPIMEYFDVIREYDVEGQKFYL